MILTIDQKWIFFFTELSKMYKEKRRKGNKALGIRGPPKKMQHIQLAKPKNQSSITKDQRRNKYKQPRCQTKIKKNKKHRPSTEQKMSTP